MITAKSLLKAIDDNRVKLGIDGAPIPYIEAAAQIGVHSAIFSRLKKGIMPSARTILSISEWVGDEAALHCETCLSTEEQDDDGPRGGSIVALIPADSDPITAASSEQPSAHMTTIWLGEAADLENPDAIVEEVKLLAAELEPFTLSATSRGTLGSDNADVVFLDPSSATDDIRAALLEEGTAVKLAHDSVDQYPEWTPHVTLGYESAPALTDYEVEEGTEVSFDRIAVWIGGDYTTFSLGDDSEEGTKVRAVFARGKLSESEDPDTQAAVTRAKELLREGAVGVSVALDLHPDDAQMIADAEKKVAESGWEKEMTDFLPENFQPRQRVRHTAIVGTPAFADARLELLDDGVTVEGVVTFEGEWTGDLRFTNLIDIDSSRTPSPILYNREAEGHEGPTIGFIDEFEWVERDTPSHRPELDDEAITASMKPMQFPASYFAQTVPTSAEPLRIGARDAQGFRAIRGLAAPKGVCHRSSMSCWTWPGDMDPKHRNFHTGTLIGLDNGSDIRVGALTHGGKHLDPILAQQGVKASATASHREDANRVFALVRVWETRFGLMLAGVVPPDVSDGDVARALACSPSIEFWPEGGKRTLVGLHLVPTPALPVMASMGGAEIVVTDERIEIEDPIELEAEDVDKVEEPEGLSAQIGALLAKLSSVEVKMGKIEETVDTILALTPIDSIEIPE